MQIKITVNNAEVFQDHHNGKVELMVNLPIDEELTSVVREFARRLKVYGIPLAERIGIEDGIHAALMSRALRNNIELPELEP